MYMELRWHRLILWLMAVWIALFVGVLFIFHVRADGFRAEAEIMMLLTVIVGAAFAYMGTAEVIVGANFGLAHRTEFLTYLALGAFSLICGVSLALSTEQSLKLAAVLVFPFALLFGLAQVRIAHGLTRHAARWSFRMCGIAELLCGIVLAGAPWYSDQAVVAILGLTAFGSLLQLIPFLAYSPKHHNFRPS